MAELQMASTTITTTTTIGPSEQSASMRLAIVLLQTFGAIALGFGSCRMKLIDASKGEMKSIGFFVGKIAFPLLIFKTVAQADVGSVVWGTIISCNLAKLMAYLLTFFLTFYISGGESRMLTATVFAFFAVASNDFAVGFPVIDALYPVDQYPEDLSTYLAINAVMFSGGFIPLTLVLFGIGGQSGTGGMDRHAVKEICKTIFTNPVMVCTLAGFVWQVGWVMLAGNDPKPFPPGMAEVVELFTKPFVTLALFLTGASLKSVSIATWPVFLVIMKVIFCATIGTTLAQVLVPESIEKGSRTDVLVNFSYLYGSIPSSSAPLIFAQMFSPAHTELVASAIIMGLVSAGPVMFLSSVLFNFDTDMLKSTTMLIFNGTLVLSMVAGGVLVFALFIGRRWFMRTPMDLVIFYGFSTLLYIASGFLLGTIGDDSQKGNCRNVDSSIQHDYKVTGSFTFIFVPSLTVMFFSIVQNMCRSSGIVLLLWRARGFPETGTKIGSLVAVLVSVVIGSVTPPSTFAEICQVEIISPWRGVAVCSVYLLLTLGLLAAPLFLDENKVAGTWRASNPFEDEHHEVAHGFFSSGLSAPERPHRLVSTCRVLGGSMMVRFLIEVMVGGILAVMGDKQDAARDIPSFKQMVVVEQIIEHSQPVLLLLVMFMGFEFQPLVERFRYGDTKTPELDLATATDHDDAIADRVHAIARPRSARNRHCMMETYSECIMGNELVTILVEAGRAADRKEGVKIAQAMLDHELVTQVDGHNDMFHDSDDAFYYMAHQDHGGHAEVMGRSETASHMKMASDGLSHAFSVRDIPTAPTAATRARDVERMDTPLTASLQPMSR